MFITTSEAYHSFLSERQSQSMATPSSSSKASSIYSTSESPFQAFDHASVTSHTSAASSKSQGSATWSSCSSLHTSPSVGSGVYVESALGSRTISPYEGAHPSLEHRREDKRSKLRTSLWLNQRRQCRFHPFPSTPCPRRKAWDGFSLPFVSCFKVENHDGPLYTLSVSLEDLYHGRRYRLPMDRIMQSGRARPTIVHVDIPPGCPSGAKIVCHDAGNERKDGTREDIVFVIEEAPHDLYYRVGRDLVREAIMPWDPKLNKEPGTVRFSGLDGTQLSMTIDYPNDKAHTGCHVIFGAGMPTYGAGIESTRGDLFVRWQIESPRPSMWRRLKTCLHIA
ncbi:hypothetical protein HGRIS_004495 [Hohenbuehelia grisea]|uniref:Chaperone DnaJ C-terminal domain-containing protein n=1 Tax=Hohenbuehelia grisea TaxID=104357 RepID=A0ABR3JCG3_9AGAR